MKNEYTSTRIWKKTVVKLRLIYALTGESMVSILDRLTTVELGKLQNKGNEQHDLERTLSHPNPPATCPVSNGAKAGEHGNGNQWRHLP